MASEDEVIGMEHLLAEPKCNEDSIDNILGCDTFNTQNCFMIEDFSSHVKYDQQKISTDTLDYWPSQEEEKSRLKFLDGVLQGADDRVLQGTNTFLDTCEDFLFNAETSEKVHNLDYGPCDESVLGAFGLAGHSPVFNGEECNAEISELSTTSAPQLGSTCTKNLPLLDNLTFYQLHEVYRNSFGNETSVTDKPQLMHRISFGLGSLGDLESSSSLLECGMASNENDREIILLSSNESLVRPSSSKALSGADQQHVKNGRLALRSDVNMSDPRGKGGLVTEKRSRKPPRRYIEESLLYHSRHRKCGSSYRGPREKLMRVRLHKQHCQQGFSATDSVCQEEPFSGPCIQVPFGLPVENGGPKKNSSLLSYERQNQHDSRFLDKNPDTKTHCATSRDDRSEDECGMGINMEMVRSRRKHHMLWTLAEVMKLIEGVSQCGVGRWTEIKRLLFSSSAHRTSVDLKDKWRNLLKASCMKLQTKRQVEQGKKHASHQMPQAVLRRVQELARAHPYPRERKPKDSGGNMVPLAAAVRV